MLARPDADLDCFASCAPGLERLLVTEARAMGIADATAIGGGVEFRGSLELACRANLELGIALQVLIRIATFRVRHFAQLDSWAARADWADWLPRGRGETIPIAAHAHRSKLHHTGGIIQRLRAGLITQLGTDSPALADDAAPLPGLHVRMVEDVCTVSLDSSGTSLQKRGWRTLTPTAPLREDVARALLVASGWPCDGLLLDPMCGSGTLAIEAACMLENRAPGLNRRFGFETMPAFDDQRWQQILANARAAVRPATDRIVASDRDEDVVALAHANARAAGVADAIDLRHLELADYLAYGRLPATRPLRIVANPPWGKRLAKTHTARAMADIGLLVRRAGKGAWASIIAPNRRMVDATGLAFRARPKTQCGGVQIGLHLRGRAVRQRRRQRRQIVP